MGGSRLKHLTLPQALNRIVNISAAVKNDGEITGLQMEQLDDYGAYLRSPIPGPLYRMHGAITGAYKVKNVSCVNKLGMTIDPPGW